MTAMDIHEKSMMDGSAGQTSSLCFKPWPVRIFKDSPLSLYFVTASESDEGLVFYIFLLIIGWKLQTIFRFQVLGII